MGNRNIPIHLDGKGNELINWLLEKLAADAGHVEGRIFYNDTEERVKVGANVGYRTVAWLSDITGASNWKASVRAATTVADGNQTLSLGATIDSIVVTDGDRVLVKNQTDPIENGIYIVNTAGAWTRAADFDESAEVTGAFVPVVEGTSLSLGGNAATIWRQIEDSPTVGVDPLTFTLFPVSTVSEDKFVKISVGDTGPEKYLRDAVSNGNAAGWALSNPTNIQMGIIGGVGNPQTLQFYLGLDTYTGDTNFIGNHTQTGDLDVTGTTTLFDLGFSAGATVDWTNTTQTGTTSYDASYVATYDDDSTVNFNGDWSWGATAIETYTAGSVTTGDQGFDASYTATYTGSTINNVGSTTNYDVTSVVNQDGTTNFGATSVTNFLDDSIISIAGDVTREATSTQVYIDGSTISGETDYTSFTADYDANSEINYNGTTINNIAVTVNYNDTPVLLSCEGAAAFATPYAADINTQYAEVTIDGAVYKVLYGIDQTLTGINFSVSATWNTLSDPNVLTLIVVEGTPTLDSLCRYNGVSVITNTNNIVINDGNIINNTDVNETYNGGNITYDSNTNVNFEGDVIMDTLTVTNIINPNGGLAVPKKVTGVVRTGPSTTLNIVDTDVDTDTVVMGRTVTAGTQLGFWEFTVNAGSIDVTSSATETGVTFNYVIL